MACGNVHRHAADTYKVGTQGAGKALGCLPKSSARSAFVDYYPIVLSIATSPSLPACAIWIFQIGPGMMQWAAGYLNSPQLPWLPLSARGYRLVRVAVLSVVPELSRYPGDDAGARRGSLVRADP